MKKKIRKLMVGKEEWHYIAHYGGATIFRPNSKDGIECDIELMKDQNGFMATTPKAIRIYIEEHLRQ